MKIESAFCDVHPDRRLAEGAAKIHSRYGLLEQPTLHCTNTECDRHFHYDLGYFPFIVGKEPDVADLASKPRCRNNHDMLYMLLTKVDSVLVYACFYPECTTTVPYEP